jgi:hypothetical protein
LSRSHQPGLIGASHEEGESEARPLPPADGRDGGAATILSEGQIASPIRNVRRRQRNRIALAELTAFDRTFVL